MYSLFTGGALETLRGRRAGHHALHQRHHHHSVADGGHPAVEQTGARRRRAHQNHPIRPLPDRAALPGRAWSWPWAGSIPRRFSAQGIGQLVLYSTPTSGGIAFKPSSPDHRHDAADVAGRTNHRTRHRQRRFPDHHDRHPGAAARGRRALKDMFFPRRRDRGRSSTSATASPWCCCWPG